MDTLNYDWQAKRLDGIILSSDGYLLSLVSWNEGRWSLLFRELMTEIMAVHPEIVPRLFFRKGETANDVAYVRGAHSEVGMPDVSRSFL